MINMKLLSLLTNKEVMGFELGEDKILVEFKNTQNLYSLNDLANKCKSIFIHYGNFYCIMSFIDFDGTWFANVSGCIYKQSFQGESEHEVVFKASNWIMEIEDKEKQIEKDAIYEEYYN